MPSNIKSIGLWRDNPKQRNKVPLVRIEFNHPCKWTVLSLDDLERILACWIEGEEEAYPRSEGFEGRWKLFKRIVDVFATTQ